MASARAKWSTAAARMPGTPRLVGSAASVYTSLRSSGNLARHSAQALNNCEGHCSSTTGWGLYTREVLTREEGGGGLALRPAVDLEERYRLTVILTLAAFAEEAPCSSVVTSLIA